MKKLFYFIKSPKFFGMSCIVAAGFIMGLLITYDISFWVQILDIIVFWTLTSTGYKILNKLDFDNELNFWIRRCYDEEFKSKSVDINKTNEEIIQELIKEGTITVRAKDGSFESTHTIDKEKKGE